MGTGSTLVKVTAPDPKRKRIKGPDSSPKLKKAKITHSQPAPVKARSIPLVDKKGKLKPGQARKTTAKPSHPQFTQHGISIKPTVKVVSHNAEKYKNTADVQMQDISTDTLKSTYSGSPLLLTNPLNVLVRSLPN